MKHKILFILHYPPPIHGAAVIGGFIKKSGYINSIYDCRFVNLGVSKSINDIGRSSIRKLISYFSLVWQVKKQLITFKPELCYLTPTSAGSGFYKDDLIIAIVKLFGVKTVFHYHNKGISTRQGRFLDDLLYKFVFRNTYVILLSKHLYTDINKYVPEKRVFYCPNGIPNLGGSEGTHSEHSELKETMNQRKIVQNEVAHSKFVEILFLSHLIHSKGILILIDACKILRERGTEFHCGLAGGDGEITRQEVEDIIIKKGLASFIFVTGPVDGLEKAELMKRAGIFVHPSYNDCLPLVLLEAMQYSLPVVSTFEGAIPEVVEEGITGFLVPQKDAKALADKLELLIKDTELRKKMGSAGRARYEKKFTLDKFEKRMIEILGEVMNGNK